MPFPVILAGIHSLFFDPLIIPEKGGGIIDRLGGSSYLSIEFPMIFYIQDLSDLHTG